MKCEKCSEDMVWQGSMIDGGMQCPSCVASDPHDYCKTVNFGSGPVTVIDDPWQLYKINSSYYRLGPQAEEDWNNFLLNMMPIGCSCHSTMAPCSWCTHPGNPFNLDARDDVIDVTGQYVSVKP